MNSTGQQTIPPPLDGRATAMSPFSHATQLKRFAIFMAVLALCFAKPLYDLLDFALHSSIYSHIVLIPCVSLYFLWVKRTQFGAASKPLRAGAIPPFAIGAVCVAGYWLAGRSGWAPSVDDYLSVMVFGFLSFLVGGAFLFFGTATLRRAMFPIGFLIFMVPFPTSVLIGIETFLQYGSAEAAYLFFTLSGMSVIQDGTQIQLPGFAMQVAPACSGIHSTLVLFITSVVAGYLFLRSPWRRGALAAVVIPLALLRNGFRIFTIGQLCVRISPDMIDSFIHRKGGPIFFALSLIPFFLLLLWLRRSETKRLHPGAPVSPPGALPGRLLSRGRALSPKGPPPK